MSRPKTDNPHVAGCEAAIAWDLGWDTAEAAKGTALPATGCAAPTGVILA